MAEITHQDLLALRESLEETTRRECDRLREDLKEDVRGVHARIKELRDRMAVQNGRVGKSEEAIATLQSDVRVQRHDANNLANAFETFRRLGGRETKPSKAFVAGAIATVLLLAGIANWILDVAHGLGGALLKELFK